MQAESAYLIWSNEHRCWWGPDRDHACCGCGKTITAGLPAVYMAMKQEGDFWAVHSHTECRDAEVDWNRQADTWGEDWNPLSSITEDEEAEDWCAWLREKHPIAAERVLS